MSAVTVLRQLDRDVASRPSFAFDATWLLLVPPVTVLLLVIAFYATLLTAGQVSVVERGTCTQYSRTAAIYQMMMMRH